VTQPGYTRYTLRLAPATAEALVDAPLEEDDWSGAAAYEWRADPAALEYAHPEAVALVRSLPAGGWQEDDDGHTLVFWLKDGVEAQPRVVEALVRLGALGSLDVSRESPGWQDAWRRFHKPQVVGRLNVRPPWYPPRDDLLDVVVEAGLAFGTGGHASTRQCLEEIQEIPPGPLLDLGSGSGVVSFAALRLGFAPVWGIDIDPVAVHAAAGNAALNRLQPTFLVGDATDRDYPLPAADTVVANIALRPIIRLARRAVARGSAAPDLQPTHLLLAGLLAEQGDEAAAAFPAYEVVGRRQTDIWLMVHLQRRT
jgi:ribosomal protein L11 methyltransferase